jgi:hypothetical protein
VIRVAPIEDAELVRQTLTRPEIWDSMADDGAMPPECFQPQLGGSAIYLGAWDDDEYLGLFQIYLQNHICCNADVSMLPTCGGFRALKAYKMGCEWLWQNTNFRRIVSINPSCNKLGLKFAKLAGFVEFGLNPNAWLKNGQLFDLVLLGVDRGRWRR